MKAMLRAVLFVLLLWPALLLAQPLTLGRIDLSTWDGHSTVSLDGEWLFWVKSLPANTPGVPLRVPGAWNGPMGSVDGWGTYRLFVQLGPAPAERLALSIPVINSASEVLWNGTTVWRTGAWAPAAYRAERRTGVVEVGTHAGENLLEIRVASYGDINAGLTEPFHLGNLAGMLSARSADITLNVFLFGCLFIMGVYHLGLWLYRRIDSSPLWFGLISILLALRGLVYGSVYLADLAPWMDWETSMRLGYLTFSATSLFFALFIRDLFPQVTPRWFRPYAFVGGGTYAVANLVLPAAWYTPALPYFQLYVGVLGGAVVVILVLALLRKSPGAGLFLAGFLIFFTTVVNDILKTNYFIPPPYLSSVGLLAFLVFQSLVMLKKFTSAFADSERYSQHLARINVSLERFIPREILSYLNKDSIVDIELGDFSERPMVVMFADIRDFTTLSESMSPRDNFQFINAYLRRMGPVVRRHNGFVDKYMGDGIMALFPDHPEDAFRAALDMRSALVKYNEHRALSNYPPIRIGIGLHRGPLMLGTIGENRRMDSTVISDTVNTSSRLEGLTKKFGVDVLVSEETINALADDLRGEFEFTYVSEESVKGRKQTLRVYQLTAT